jgi:hypothetical protein
MLLVHCFWFLCLYAQVFMLVDGCKDNTNLTKKLIYTQFWIFDVHSNCFISIELCMLVKLDLYATLL